jgi:hypothetical protein
MRGRTPCRLLLLLLWRLLLLLRRRLLGWRRRHNAELLCSGEGAERGNLLLPDPLVRRGSSPA